MLSAGCDPNEVDESNLCRWTALHWAVSTNQQKVCHALIARKASLNVKDTEGRTPIDLAAELKFSDLLRFLRGSGRLTSKRRTDLPRIGAAATSRDGKSVEQEAAPPPRSTLLRQPSASDILGGPPIKAMQRPWGLHSTPHTQVRAPALLLFFSPALLLSCSSVLPSTNLRAQRLTLSLRRTTPLARSGWTGRR